jgi:two-component system response regulator HupR/HoxA
VSARVTPEAWSPLQLREDPRAQLVARLLRRRWGLWCGLLLPGGEVIPLEEGAGSGPAACAALQQRQDAAGSCERSVRRWSEAARDGEVQGEGVSERSCHAGLRALLRPLRVGGRGACTLYVSGFWGQAGAAEGAEALRRRGQALQAGRLREEQVPVLHERDQAWVAALLEELAQALERGAAEAPPAVEAPTARYREIIGRSAPLLELFRVLDKVAASDATVLIQGENGTGKELIARAVHAHSRRRDQHFVVQNCSALNDNLLDSELFGHRKGSFTGASQDKQGLFELAHGGTFFLDEVGDMSPTLQVKMLRVLQEGTFLPVGGTVTRKVDVRIIAATNRDLKAMVKEGSFREDLFYRLNVINVVVPPLRERRADLPLLLAHFLERAGRRMGVRPGPLEEEARALLAAYDWPGNVRELENEIERLVVLAGEGEAISAALLSPRLRAPREVVARAAPEAVPEGDLPGALEEMERKMLLESLRRTGWNKTRTARELGISRRNLIRKVERYQLEELRGR